MTSPSWMRSDIYSAIIRDDGRPADLFQHLYEEPSNKNEAVAHRHLLDLGKGVVRKGWPDFMVFGTDELFVVEVKGAGDQIRPAQRLVLEYLAERGIDTYIAHVNDDQIWFEAVGDSTPWAERGET